MRLPTTDDPSAWRIVSIRPKGRRASVVVAAFSTGEEAIAALDHCDQGTHAPPHLKLNVWPRAGFIVPPGYDAGVAPRMIKIGRDTLCNHVPVDNCST